MKKEEMEVMLSTMSNDELDMIRRMAELAKDERLYNRRKELWGNVVAAIKKYQEETGKEISVDLDGGADEGYFRLEDTAKHPGTLYVGILS